MTRLACQSTRAAITPVLTDWERTGRLAIGRQNPEASLTYAYETVAVEVRGDVHWLSLNRPQALNAITTQMVVELSDYFGRLFHDRSCRIVVMRGAGRAFCAGLDIKAHGGEEPPFGGGFAFALASDIRLAGESAKMNAAFIRLGLSSCDMGVSYFLPRVVGLSVASELMMTGRFIDAHRALATGLVSEVVADDALPSLAQSYIDDMLATSPIGLRMTKEGLGLAVDAPSLEAAMAIENRNQLLCAASEDFAEGLRAFREKRRPVFRGK